MAIITYESIAGDTSDVWEIGFDTSNEGEELDLATLTGDFSCRIAVRDADPVIDREITDKNTAGDRFRAWLTSEETRALGPRTWSVGIQITNLTLSPPLVKEHQLKLKLSREIVIP